MQFFLHTLANKKTLSYTCLFKKLSNQLFCGIIAMYKVMRVKEFYFNVPIRHPNGGKSDLNDFYHGMLVGQEGLRISETTNL